MKVIDKKYLETQFKNYNTIVDGAYLKKNQGAANNGKILQIDSSGLIVPVSLINDTTASTSTVYSSSKVNGLLNTKATINDEAATTSSVYSSSKMDSTYLSKNQEFELYNEHISYSGGTESYGDNFYGFVSILSDSASDGLLEIAAYSKGNNISCPAARIIRDIEENTNNGICQVSLKPVTNSSTTNTVSGHIRNIGACGGTGGPTYSVGVYRGNMYVYGSNNPIKDAKYYISSISYDVKKVRAKQ